MKQNRRHRLFLAAALLLACAAAWPLIREAGLLNTRGGGDSPFLLQRLQQLETAVRDGHFPVRWMRDANYGYGYPFFNFYAPLAFYVALLFRFVGFTIVRSIQLSQLLAFIVAAGGMYALGWRWFKNQWAALLSSAAYTLAPFHLVNVYVRGDSIAEFWAMAFYPLVILALTAWPQTAVERRQVVKAVIVVAVTYAGLIVSHNISALIFSPFVFAYALIKILQGRYSGSVSNSESNWFKHLLIPQPLSLILAFTLALALAAWFWLPALGEQGLTQLDSITADYFNYNNHFRTADLVQWSFFFDFGTDTLQAFRMGLMQTTLIVWGGWALLGRGGRGRGPANSQGQQLWWFVLGSLLLATVMITPLTKPLWDNLPLLPFTQFPWRFLAVQAFWGALTAAYLIMNVGESVRPWLTTALIALLFVSSLGQLSPNYLYVNDGDITAERLAQYEWFSGNIGTTISAEYLAPTMQPRPFTSVWLNEGERWRANVVAGRATAAITERGTQQQRWDINVTSDKATVVLPTMYWAGWQATDTDGQALALQPATGSGLMQVTLPHGEHSVVLTLGRTAVRWWSELLSLLAVWGIAGMIVWLRPWQSWPTLAFTGRQVGVAVLVVGFLGVALFVWNNRQKQLQTAQTLNWDFGEMAYLHHAPQGVRYGNGAHLADYELSSDVVTAGNTLQLVLNWDVQPQGDVREVTVQLTNPANNFYNYVPPVVAQTRPLQAGAQVYELAIPADAPAGLYFPLVTLSDNNRPRTANGKLRAALALRPVRVLAAPLSVPDSDFALDVRPLSVVQRSPNVLDLQLAWYTAVARAENLKLSLRLTNEGGAEIFRAQFDNQPGYGYQPSVGWQAGQWTADWLAMYLPDELPFPPPYKLLVQLYDSANDKQLLTRRLGRLTLGAGGELVFEEDRPSFTLPEDIVPAEAIFSTAEGEPVIALRGYTLQRDGDKVNITLYWEALAAGEVDYTHFVHLLDPVTGQPVAQHDAMPQNNTYPTSQWRSGEIVADELQLALQSVPQGVYALSVGLYQIVDANTFPRLAASTAAGEPLPHNVIVLTEIER